MTPVLNYMVALASDIPSIASIRSAEWEGDEFWIDRITRYMNRQHHPQKALMPRVTYLALAGDTVVGFISGHLTTRYSCNGEVQWLNVAAAWRRSGAASGLLRLLAQWFLEQNATKVCVNVDPSNVAARLFYRKHLATNLNEHWMVWNNILVVAAT
jgi:ribosomal protein S18 acetylase RimI-like enzyme